MKLVRRRTASGEVLLGSLEGEQIVPLDLEGRQYNSLFDILEADDPHEVAMFLRDEKAEPIDAADAQLLPPIDQQEVWAAGVTYKRSKVARMEESDAAASCYDRVYVSDRPELFFKATPHRVSGPGEPLRIRRDSQWNVPEPELTLVVNSYMKLVGFTIGNDMSSRDIEGDNPLYLPQAKVYNHCCGLGPCVLLADSDVFLSLESVRIELTILRQGKTVFVGDTNLGEMARTFEELLGWLSRDNSFPNGVFLLTGTGVVPDADFTLLPGDIVKIEIDEIGVLSNPVVQD